VDESEHIAPRASSRTQPEDRLDSWKKIASYLRRDVSTVQRWERRERLPVHRHLHDKQGSVYAFRTELDQWWESRRSAITQQEETAQGVPAIAQPAAESATPGVLPPGLWLRSKPAVWVALAVVAAAALGWILTYATPAWRSPLDEARFTRVADFPGFEQAAGLSRDGHLVAFIGEQEGHHDVWISELGSGHYRNLTRGVTLELVNPSIRTLGFTPDAARVSIWTRGADGSRPGDVNIVAVPARGGTITSYLPGVAEFDWSHRGTRLVYHSTAPGDPIYVRDGAAGAVADRKVYTGSAGVHCHFPIWSLDDAYIYFVRGVPPDDWDLWRVRADGTQPERLSNQHARLSYPVLLDARNLAYLATDADGSGPWLYILDLKERRSHRISSALQTFTSLSASADGMKLVATLSSPRDSLWRVPLTAPTSGVPTQAAPVKVLGNGANPRLSDGTLIYTAASADTEAIWVLQGESAHEIWRSQRAHLLNAPAISDDGRRMAFATSEDGKTVLNVVALDGSHFQRIAASLVLRGNVAWFPDGLSLLCAVVHEGEPRLMRIYLNGEPPTVFVAEYSTDPVWAPDHRFVVYSGSDIGTTFPLRAAAPDGRPYPIAGVMLTRGARRVSFSPGSESLVILDGEIGHKNFWLLDLAAGTRRQLTELPADYEVRDFDVSADGTQIVFDRVEAGSEMAVIDRARR
jgi:Tol biopolymer transport system component